MLKLFGGTYPPGHDATSFVDFAAHADAIIDTEALPNVLSPTGTNEKLLANRIAVNLVLRSMWASAGGDLSGKPEPLVLDQILKDHIRQLAMDLTEDGFTSIDMIDEDA
jgi:hypothetical protein